MLGCGGVWAGLCCTCARVRKCAKEQRNPHAPPFYYISLNLLGLFSLGLFACFPFLYTCMAVICLVYSFACSCLCISLLYCCLCSCIYACVVWLVSIYVIGLLVE